MKSRATRNATLSSLLRKIRVDLYGDGEPGQEAMAARLGLPSQSWANFEAGVSMPACVMLELLVATGADPKWLMTGEGRRYLEP